MADYYGSAKITYNTLVSLGVELFNVTISYHQEICCTYITMTSSEIYLIVVPLWSYSGLPH